MIVKSLEKMAFCVEDEDKVKDAPRLRQSPNGAKRKIENAPNFGSCHLEG